MGGTKPGLCFFSYQPTTGAIARLCVSAPRRPVAQASYSTRGRRPAAAPCGARGGGRVAIEGGPCRTSRPARRPTHRGDVDQVHRHRRLYGVAGADGRREVVGGVQKDDVDSGATLEARSESPASLVDEVTQKRSPKVATAHSMMSSAGASSSSAPTWKTISLELIGACDPRWSEPRRARAASVLGAVISTPRSGRGHWTRGTQLSDHADNLNARRHDRHSQGSVTKPLLDLVRKQVLVAAVGAVERHGAGAHVRERLLAASGSRRRGRPRGEGLAVLAVGEEVVNHDGDVVVQAGAGDLVGAQLLAEAVGRAPGCRRGAPGTPRPGCRRRRARACP